MAGLFGIKAEHMEQVDALQKLRADYPNGFPLVRPHVLAPVIRRVDGAEAAETARFGFSRRFSSFNARDDKLTSGKMWSKMFGASHGIVPISYVVEWLVEQGERKPFLIRRRDGKPILAPALVGAYHGNKQESAFAICTREPNRFFRTFHNRMIGQLDDEHVQTWLSPEASATDALLACVAAPDDEALEAAPASPDITKRKAGDWSPLETVGRPVTWDDVK